MGEKVGFNAFKLEIDVNKCNDLNAYSEELQGPNASPYEIKTNTLRLMKAP